MSQHDFCACGLLEHLYEYGRFKSRLLFRSRSDGHRTSRHRMCMLDFTMHLYTSIYISDVHIPYVWCRLVSHEVDTPKNVMLVRHSYATSQH